MGSVRSLSDCVRPCERVRVRGRVRLGDEGEEDQEKICAKGTGPTMVWAAMETEEKLVFWANAYNAALTGLLSAGGRVTIEVPEEDRNLIRQNCQNFADEALKAIEKQSASQEPRSGFH